MPCIYYKKRKVGNYRSLKNKTPQVGKDYKKFIKKKRR